MNESPTLASAQKSIRRHCHRRDRAVVLILAGGVGGWATTTELSGALIAPGSIVVDSNVKKVQHPTGGIVGEVRVRDGDRVKAGDIVVRLDETVTRANLAIVTKGLNELTARKARLEAERDGAETIIFPRRALAPRRTSRKSPRSCRANASCSTCAARARTGQKAQLRQRIGQLSEEIGGLTAQHDAKTKEVALIERELTGVRDLFAEEPDPDQPPDPARTRGHAAGRRARPAHRGHGAGQGQDLRARAADHPDRPGPVERSRQGNARGRRQDRRIRRAQGHRRGPAQAHRHPLAAGRHRVPVQRAHGRRRDHGRRRHHADRAARPTT